MERTLENLEAIKEQLSIRNEELQQEKEALIVDNHKLQKEAADQAKQLGMMRSA